MLLWKILQIIVYSVVVLNGNYVQAEEPCNVPLTANLRDDQFSASSEYDVRHNASAARSSGEGWIAGIRSSNEYLQIDLDTVWLLTALDVHGSNYGWYAKTFRISYSSDGFVWNGYNTRLSQDSLGELFYRPRSLIEFSLDPPIKARYITINPVISNGYASLRIELYGCQSSGSTSGAFTNIQSDIEVDTTWIPNQSPILINRPISVRSSAVLTVLAGVNVIFTKETARMDIYGTLSVEGIQGLPALFTSQHPLLSVRSKWQGVSQGAGGYLNMTHAVIRQAVTGIQGNGSSVKISHSEIHSCEHGIRLAGGIGHNFSNMIQLNDLILTGIYVHDNKFGLLVHGEPLESFIPIGYSSFNENEMNGVSVSNWDRASNEVIKTDLYIVNCSMNNNSDYGLSVDERILTNIFIWNSTFMGNVGTGLYIIRSYNYLGNETVYISNTSFIENRNYGLKVYCYVCESNTHVYVNNTFQGHSGKGMEIRMDLKEEERTYVTIDSNIFTRNLIDIKLHIKNNGQAVIHNNYFQQSRSSIKLSGGETETDLAILFENTFTEHASTYDDPLIEIDRITTNITNCTFTNSSVQTLIRFNNGFDHVFAYNRFVNTSMTSCFLSVRQAYDPDKVIHLDYNYWDTSDMYGMKSKICDFFLNSSKAVAKVNFFFPTIMMETPTSATELDDFRFVTDDVENATWIGGIVKSTIDFSSVGNDQIFVNRSILISESASVTLSGSTIQFANNRGIVVHGSLTLGKGDNYSRRTILRHVEGGSWNWIDLYSKGITVTNMDLFGSQRFLTVHGRQTDIVVENCTMADDPLQYLVYADMINGNLSININNTSVKSRSSTLYIKMNDSENLNLNCTGSTFSSGSYVIQLLESIRHYNVRHVNVNITNCSMYSSRYNVHLASCSSHLAGAIRGSNISTSNPYYGSNYFKFPSMDILVTENNFGSAADLYFTFCDQLKPLSNSSKVINITSNVFNSSRSGQDITIYKYYTNEQSHTIYVTYNIFDYKDIITRRRIKLLGNMHSDHELHTMLIDSNRFGNSTDRLIDLSLGFDKVLITNNIFANNTQCIYISSSQKMNKIEISDNIFSNNTLTDGVIYLDRVLGNITSLTRNTFVNNTNTVIALRVADIYIRYNFFENGADTYNLKVLPGDGQSNKVVNVSMNYWGTTDVKEIAKTIYDKDYDDALFDVVFRPYLGSKNITDIQNEETSFVTSDGEIGGTVNGNVTLTIDRSPYLAVSNIEVGIADHLTIDAGVVMYVKAGLGIKVFGKMSVFGTKEQPVVMLPEVTGSPWRGVELRYVTDFKLRYLVMNDTQEGLRIEGSKLNVHNLTSTFAQQSGITLMVYDNKNFSEQTNINISEVIVQHNGWHGIHVSGESSNIKSVSIDNCIVANNIQNGIRIETDTEIKLNNCIIKNNIQSGISLDQTGSGITYVNSSTIANNKKYAIEGNIARGFVTSLCNVTKHDYGYIWTARRYIDLTTSNVKQTFLEFRHTNFIDNVADGIYISKNYYGGGKMTINIENCSFSGGNRTLVLSDNSRSWVMNQMVIKFVHNTIENNNFWFGYRNSDHHLIKLVLNKNYTVDIKDNIFRNNTAQTSLHISRTQQPAHGSVHIHGNRFSMNNFSVSTIDLESYVHLEVHKNIFQAPNNHACIITAPTFDINFVVNATYNFWGTATAKTVFEKMCGFDKDMGKSYIWYIPYFRDDALVETVSVHPYTLNVSSTFGGEVKEDVVISKEEFPTPILIDRSIMIREGAVLQVESGVVFNFKNNRGIYVQGSLKILGSDSTVVLEKAANASFWYGVMINSSSKASQDKTVIVNTRIEQMLYGIVLYSQNAEIRRISIVNSTHHCLTIYQSSMHGIYDFEKSQFENCSDSGISIVGNGLTTVMHVDIRMTKTGISLSALHGLVDIQSVNISESTQAVSVAYHSISGSGNITIANCLFTNCSKGLKLSSQNYFEHNSINISKNTFKNVTSGSLNLIVSNRYSYHKSIANRMVDVYLNTLTNSCGVTFETWNNVNLTVHDNVFLDADCSDQTDCFLYANGNDRFLEPRLFDISTNLFQNISSKCIALLKDNTLPNLRGTFVYNRMIGNSANKGVVGLDALYFNVSQNIFDNPETAFDVYAYKRGTETVNVTNNWWGSSDADKVNNRIFDQRLDPGLILFETDPVLTERVIDCSGVNNCSSHGECVSPNRCRCESGWTGSSCMEYDCAGVSGCYGNGKCTGPDVCDCYEGWSGTLCITASCNSVNNCSGHGICVRPDVCTCAVTFTGNDCSSCVPLHWGAKCRPCPECKHGTCNLHNGLCECNGVNWSGYLCDRCSETFYGPECLPLIKVLNIVPNKGRDKGGNRVHVWGHNFPKTSDKTYTCKFGTKEINGTWLARNHVECVAPQHQKGAVTLEISAIGQEYTNDRLMYYFYATCPPGSCGRDLNPSRGQCFFGGCSCFLPWMGENCEQQLLAPVIIKPTFEQTIDESSTYTLQLTLQQGDPLILWSLLMGPKGLTIDERTGLVRWIHAYADSLPYEVQARARNLIGQDTVIWRLTVPVSYSVSVGSIEPNGVLPVPRPVQIYGTVTFSSPESSRVVPIDIIVKSARNGRETKLQELSDPLAPTIFKTTYFPRPDDTGLFTASARHPGAKSSMVSNVTWSVLGMRCEPSAVTVNQMILSDDGIVTVHGISSLINIGNNNVANISAKVAGLPGAFVRPSGYPENSDFFLTNFAAGDKIEFDLVVTNAKPLSGKIYVVFTSEDGTSTSLIIHIKLSIQKPNLIFDPPSLHKNIVRGQIRIFDIKISNTGEVAAGNVGVSLPADDRLSLVSFTVLSNQSSSSSVNTIPSGGAAQMTLAVTSDDNAALGEMTGTIFINSDLTSNPFSYRFYITSLEKFNVTFTVKDEYTYFAAGSPLVSNAKVTFVNPRRGYSETRYTSNETGYVVFENVYEDKYSIVAEAEGHSSYGAVILVTPDTTEQDIFLQRVAVKYTWTVEPTTVEDVYVIQLESTFETNVPMPVVTIWPAKVNTIPYELEEADTIEFNITNHGLIRADNVRFTLPTDHPYLNFELTVDFIGSVDANTSIIVPVKATLKHRVKRNVVAAMAVCGLALLYEYACEGIHMRNIDITLTREYPGRSPLPCGLGGGGGGEGENAGGSKGGGVTYSNGGSRTGSGSSVTYNPTTHLSCACANTLIKGCLLAFNSIAGCTYALTDLGTSIARNEGSYILGTLFVIRGLADTTFGCPVSLFCSVCARLYTAARCYVDVSSTCDGARRRRDISSEIVNNLLTTAKPMDNFLQMMTEILGDQGMYNFESVWYTAFKKTVGEESDIGTLLSKNEEASVLETLTEQAAKANLSRFLERWNNTAAAWENGTLTELEHTGRVISLTRLNPRIEQYLIDIESAKAKGFDSIFDAFDYASIAYKTAEQQQSSSSGGSQNDEGVCARVRVRIVQELVLTRNAFNAKLEIENGESSDLESIRVEIHIKQTFGTGDLTNDNFSIGVPTVIGISGIDGSGTLYRDMSGSAEWLIIPYSNAAPEDDTQYDIGGRLSYSVGGSEFSVPLLPDTITVKPNPSLVVHYFHEKYVRGDDALTPEIEPIIPFSLAVMVMNNGYGVARALKITSGQPEIIENEKGLLIPFKIIGAQLGNNPITQSLSVEFGDITSFETKTARWLLTSTVMGTFYNYSATVENINPLGDPQLSLLDELGYHELIQLVRIEFPDQDDGLDDFLVNDFVDGQGMPDKLYNSRNGSDVEDVYTMNVTDVKVILISTAKEYKFVTLTVKTNTSLWFYIRQENTFTSPDSASNEFLLFAEVAGGRGLLVGKNVWQTTHILDTFYIHLLDFIENNSTGDTSMEIDIQYVLVYGPRNIYAPRFNSTAYTATISKSRNVGFEVITVYAYDIDNDRIQFGLNNKHATLFNISTHTYSSASIIVNNDSMSPGLVTLVVIAKDSGIPPRTASVNVTIHITDTDVTNTTPIASVTNMTTPSTASTVTKITNTSGSVSTTRSTSASSQNVTPATSITTISSTIPSFTANGTSSPTVEKTTKFVTTDETTTKTVFNTTQIASVTNVTTPSTASTVSKIINTSGSVSTSRSTSASSQNETSATSITTNSSTIPSFTANGTSSPTVENTTTSVTTDETTATTVSTVISTTMSSPEIISLSTTSTVTEVTNTSGSVSTTRPTSANGTASVSLQNVTSATSITTISPTTQSFATNGTSSSIVENTTTSVTTDKATAKTVSTTISSTLSSTESISSMSSDTPQTTPPQSTDNATMTTPRKSSTTPADGIQDEQGGDEVPRWVIPMSLGIAVLVISVAALVCVLRKKP